MNATKLVPPERRRVEYVTLTCLHCQTQFECHPAHYKDGRRKFCKKACQSAHQSTLTGEKSPRFGKPNTLTARGRMAAAARNRELGRKQRGEKHPSWKGGTYTRDGYRCILISTLPESERATMAPMADRSGYAPEHRIVAARKIGRALMPDEIAHHVNGEKQDNRPENIEVIPRSEHTKEHRLFVKELAALRRRVAELEAENAALRSRLT